RASSSSRRLRLPDSPRAQGWRTPRFARLTGGPCPHSSRLNRSSLHSFRTAVSLALILAALAGACATTPPARRDVVVGLVGEPRTVFDDDPSARFVAAAVTESLVRRDEHDELVPRLAESVPTIENGERRADEALAPRGRPSHRLAQAPASRRAAYAREPVHAGPFAIAAWLPGSITLSAFKDYVLGPPKLGRLEIHFFATRAAALQA